MKRKSFAPIIIIIATECSIRCFNFYDLVVMRLFLSFIVRIFSDTKLNGSLNYCRHQSREVYRKSSKAITEIEASKALLSDTTINVLEC